MAGYRRDYYGIEEKRYELIQAELDKLRIPREEFDQIDSEMAGGLDIDSAVEKALALLSGGAKNTEENKKLRNGCLRALEIRKLDESEVERQYEAYRQRMDESRRKQAEEADKREFFNDPEAVADFFHWDLKQKLYVEQAVALSLGKDPNIVTLDRLTALRRPNSPFVMDYMQRLGALQRAVDEHHISRPLTLSKFVQWANTQGDRFRLPRGLDDKFKAKSIKADQDDLHHSTQDVFYKLLMAMAINHYEFFPPYDPENGDQSRAFQLMTNDILDVIVNTTMTPKTLREHMEKAQQHAQKRGYKFKRPQKKAR
jgi:hypothetical protein